MLVLQLALGHEMTVILKIANQPLLLKPLIPKWTTTTTTTGFLHHYYYYYCCSKVDVVVVDIPALPAKEQEYPLLRE
jgi:hypothetical protein